MKIQTFLAFTIFLIFFFSGCNTNEFFPDKQPFHDAVTKGNILLQGNQIDSAYFYFDKALQASYSEDTKIYSLLQLATIEIEAGDFNSSEEILTQAHHISTTSTYSAAIYTLLGISYLEQNNYIDALKYYYKALSNASSELDKCIIQNNIAVVHLEKKDFQKAILIEERILQNEVYKADKKNLAKALDNLGFAYFKTNNNKAYNYLKKAESLRDSINDDFEKLSSYIHLAEFHQKNNPILASTYSQKAYETASRVKSPDDQIEALHFWIITAPMEQTKTLALIQMKVTDSIYKERQFAKNQFARIKYDASNALTEKNIAHQRSIIILWILIIVAIFAVSIIFFIRYRSRIKLTQSIYSTETRISKKIHDELANDVFQALSFVETQDFSNPETKEKFLDDLDHIYMRTRNISNDNSTIDTGVNYPDHLFNMMGSFNSDQTNVIINTAENLSFTKIKSETKIVLYRVMQELLVNMKKHSKCSVVVISISLESKQIEIRYSDNGQGFDSKEFQKKGLQNVENRIRAVKGFIIFDSKSNFGLKINITLPI